jgi:hypothetical protein
MKRQAVATVQHDLSSYRSRPLASQAFRSFGLRFNQSVERKDSRVHNQRTRFTAIMNINTQSDYALLRRGDAAANQPGGDGYGSYGSVKPR